MRYLKQINGSYKAIAQYAAGENIALPHVSEESNAGMQNWG